ncbi:hypothetical protein PTE30175_02057 [Pandoraea terrae]|uniref:Uncharacterized protein n=1 Tax=Pandoraea terrae TaxID=1537710 RepID=A0A5E4UQ31_9BURK|nr:hypothetical protein PTE30175_02057 [Pandoraea terrae]
MRKVMNILISTRGAPFREDSAANAPGRNRGKVKPSPATAAHIAPVFKRLVNFSRNFLSFGATTNEQYP